VWALKRTLRNYLNGVVIAIRGQWSTFPNTKSSEKLEAFTLVRISGLVRNRA
jgi:hypothetical protein